MTTADYLEQLEQDRQDLVDNLETQGITGLSGDETFTELVPEVLNISGGGTTEPEEKEVNFYDYDGTRVYSYTSQEFLALEEMPANPSRDGLTAQGWNWTLQDAQNYVRTYGYLVVGQNYVTDDGATRIYVDLRGAFLKPYMQLMVNGTLTIDWGDNTAFDTITGTSTNTAIDISHTYAEEGNYVIRLIPSNDTINFGFVSQKILWDNVSTGNTGYATSIKKIELGTHKTLFLNNEFRYISFESINIPTTLSGHETGSNVFSDSNIKCLIFPISTQGLSAQMTTGCRRLKVISIPKGNFNAGSEIGDMANLNVITMLTLDEQISSGQTYGLFASSKAKIITGGFASSYYRSTYAGCYNLTKVVLRPNTTGIGQAAFGACYGLSNIKIPSGVVSISASAFNNCTGMKYYDFSECTSVPALANVNAFNGIPADCKIIVPDNLYNDWIVASNWSTYASYIIKKTNWDALQ